MKKIYCHMFAIVFMIFAVATAKAEPLLQSMEGKTIPFSSLKGKWVFINYWAGWCDICVDEIPELNKFYQSHKHSGKVVLYGVNYDALPAKEQRILLSKYHISYPSLLKDPAKDLALGDIAGVPLTFIFSPQGQLVKTLYGGQSAKTLNQVMA